MEWLKELLKDKVEADKIAKQKETFKMLKFQTLQDLLTEQGRQMLVEMV